MWFVICFRFIPPENFDLALLTPELESVKKGTKNEQVIIDFQSIILSFNFMEGFILCFKNWCSFFFLEVVLANQLKKRFMNQVEFICL